MFFFSFLESGYSEDFYINPKDGVSTTDTEPSVERIPTIKSLERQLEESNKQNLYIGIGSTGIAVVVGAVLYVIGERKGRKQKNQRLDEISISLTMKLIPLVIRTRNFVQTYEKKSEEHYRNFDDSFWDEISNKWDEFRESNKLLDDLRMANPNVIPLHLDDELRELSRLIKTNPDRQKYDITTQLIYSINVYAENCLGKLKKYADILVRERREEIENTMRALTEKTNLTDPQIKSASNLRNLFENNLKELTDVLFYLEKRGFK